MMTLTDDKTGLIITDKAGISLALVIIIISGAVAGAVSFATLSTRVDDLKQRITDLERAKVAIMSDLRSMQRDDGARAAEMGELRRILMRIEARLDQWERAPVPRRDTGQP